MRAEVNLHSLMRNIEMEVSVTGVVQFRGRVWLGILLMKLAAKVMGTKMEVVTCIQS